MAQKTAIVEITVEYRVIMDEYGDIVDAEPVMSLDALRKEAIRMADGVEFEEEDV